MLYLNLPFVLFLRLRPALQYKWFLFNPELQAVNVSRYLAETGPSGSCVLKYIPEHGSYILLHGGYIPVSSVLYSGAWQLYSGAWWLYFFLNE